MGTIEGPPPIGSRLSHVEESLSRLDRHIDGLAEHANTLSSRLMNVLRPEEPPPLNAVTSGEQAQVPLVNSINDLACRVHEIDLIISSILERLEL